MYPNSGYRGARSIQTLLKTAGRMFHKTFRWCFRGSKTPEITLGVENGGLTLQPMALEIPMPSDLEEVNSKFAELVDELDLDRPHREAMFSLPPEKKWQIYCSKKKEQEDPSSTSWPDYYIDRVGQMATIFVPYDEDEINARAKQMDNLKTALRTQPIRFVTRFIELNGLQCLLDFLSNMDNVIADSAIHPSAIGCIKALLNNSHGRAHVLAHPACINTIAQSLKTENVRTKIAVLEILGAVCLVPGGHRKVLESMVHFKKFSGERTRFQTLIIDLDRPVADYQEELALKTTIISFINAALKYGPGQDHLEFRMHLRYEFLMLGIMPVIDKLREYDNETLTRHLDFFEMVRNEDEKEIAKRYDVTHIDSKSATHMLDILKKKLAHTLAYPHLLSVLFHLLELPNNGNNMSQYWQLVDRMVQQVAIQLKDGSDPDDSPLEINVLKIVKQLASENEIKAIQHQLRQQQKDNDELTSKLSKKEHECEVKTQEMDELMEMVNRLKTKYEQEACNHGDTKAKLEQTMRQLEELAKLIDAERAERSKLEHMIKTGSLPDDAKAGITSAASSLAAQLKKAAENRPKVATPPPPPPAPPVPKIGGPPAPPPPPGPPAPGLPSLHAVKKNIPKSGAPLKSFNWVKLAENKIKGTVWSDLDDTRLFRALDLASLEKNFSAYQKPNQEEEVGFKSSKQRVKELSVIDGRRAQNCTITLSKLKMTNDEISRAVMTMDEREELPKDMCEQLLKFIPTPEESQMLNEHEHEIDEMARADRFLYDMAKIVHYEQRLKALYYKKKFSERMGDVKPRVQAVMKATQQISTSKRLRKLLEIVLAFGNFMNRGQRGNAFGFRISSLLKIIDTKSSIDRKVTLLHYLIQVLEKKFPDIMKINIDMPDVTLASKVAMTDLDADIAVLRKGLDDIKAEVKFYKQQPYTRGDKFISSMEKFVMVSSINFSELEESVTEMKQKYDKVLGLYGEESKMQPDEFFGIFDQFLSMLYDCKKENERFRKMAEEEERRAKVEAQLKAERAKKMNEKNKTLVNGSDKGEFDDLISALRTGEVFGEEISKLKRGRRRGSAQNNGLERERVGNVRPQR
ncbi:disheveled-associated activator of morphogenesis 1-like [Tubulanus polymorphus]|uniref:disheveled-associated activator of morphogenesis 1-like n=1 Tax=Tubulanus polymorphus TaxID=672921 RepID=UPI003DA3DBE2